MKLVRSKLFWFAAVLVAVSLILTLSSAITGKPTFLATSPAPSSRRCKTGFPRLPTGLPTCSAIFIATTPWSGRMRN